MTFFQDQKSSSSYLGVLPGFLVNTVEPNTTARKIKRRRPDTAWSTLIFFFRSRRRARIRARQKITEKQITSRMVQALLWVMII